MARIDKDQFPIIIIKIPEDQFPDKLSIVIEGSNVDTQRSKNTQLAIEALDAGFDTPFDKVNPNEVGNVNISSAGVSANLKWPKFYTESAFNQSFKSRGVNFKAAVIDTPFNNLESVNAWAHRDNWEDNTEIEIEMFASSDLKDISAAGPVWSRRMTLRKYGELPIDYAVGFLLNGNPYGKAGKLIKAIIPLVQALLLFLTEDLKPNVPTAKQIAMKLLGPSANIVQQKLAYLEEQYAKVKRMMNEVQRLLDIMVECNVLEDPVELPEIRPPNLPIPSFGIREKTINLIKDLSPNLDISTAEIESLFDTEIGISDQCLNNLYELLGIIYEVIPKEGISNVIYEFGE